MIKSVVTTIKPLFQFGVLVFVEAAAVKSQIKLKIQLKY